VEPEPYEGDINSKLENTGFTSPNLKDNLDFLPVIIIVGLVFLFLSLPMSVIKKFRDKLKEKLEKLKKELIWNGAIESITAGYLNYTIVLSSMV
jgi:hypothetical protein